MLGASGSRWWPQLLNHLSSPEGQLHSGVMLDPLAVELRAPPREVWAHANYEVAQTQLEVVQAVAQAKLELAQAKRAVVHAHVPGDELWDGGMRGMLDGIGQMWSGRRPDLYA